MTADWESIADRTPDELLSSQSLPEVSLSSQSLPEVSKLSLEDTKVQTPKRRGRGTFSYKKHELYSDQVSDKLIVDNDTPDDENVSHNLEGDPKVIKCELLVFHISFGWNQYAMFSFI